jgi:uncharacterized membrane protein/uncharacterized protein with GYD domain
VAVLLAGWTRTFTDQRIRAIKGLPSRLVAAGKRAESPRASVERACWTLGRCGRGVMFGRPEEAVAAPTLEAGSIGNERSTMLRAFAADEIRPIPASTPRPRADPGTRCAAHRSRHVGGSVAAGRAGRSATSRWVAVRAARRIRRMICIGRAAGCVHRVRVSPSGNPKRPLTSMFLTTAEANAIAGRIAAIEAHTGVQVVAAVVGRAARYPEARWKAFAFAVAFAAAGVVAWTWLRPGWSVMGATLGGIVAILGAGIASALIATWSERCERLFVRRNRAEVEVGQYAEGLFLARELYATPSRTAVLLVVSLLERVVVVRADRGFAGRIAADEWDGVVAPMTTALRAGRRAAAVEAGLDALEALLADRGFVATGAVPNALPDRPLEERGP